jgi:hypothetical protein
VSTLIQNVTEADYAPQGAININGMTGETQMNDAEEIPLYTHHLKIRVMKQGIQRRLKTTKKS